MLARFHGDPQVFKIYVQSTHPVPGCLPLLHGVPGSPSTAFRDGGIIMEPWPEIETQTDFYLIMGFRFYNQSRSNDCDQACGIDNQAHIARSIHPVDYLAPTEVSDSCS